MRLKKFTPARAVKNLISKGVQGYLYPDGRFTNGFLWLELPKEAAEKARKLNLETTELPSIGRAIIHYRQGQPTEAQLVRFYYDGMNPDYAMHKTGRARSWAMSRSCQWYAEFAVNGTIYSYKADYVLALEYAAGITENTKRPNIDKWLIFTEADKPVLEAWNGHCIGGVFPLIRNGKRHWRPKCE